MQVSHRIKDLVYEIPVQAPFKADVAQKTFEKYLIKHKTRSAQNTQKVNSYTIS